MNYRIKMGRTFFDTRVVERIKFKLIFGLNDNNYKLHTYCFGILPPE